MCFLRKIIYVVQIFVRRLTQKFSDTLLPTEEKFLKRILEYLNSTKYNEINTFH